MIPTGVDADVRTAALRLVERWAAAEQAGDGAALAAVLAAGFVGIGPVGLVLDRDQWVAGSPTACTTVRSPCATSR